MAAITVVPSTTTPGSTVDVLGTGFNTKYKFSLTTTNSNGVEVGQTTNINRPKRDGTFQVGINVPPTGTSCIIKAYQNSKLVAQATVTLQVTTPPPTQKIVTFSVGQTHAQFLTLMKDLTVDIIEIAAGTYPKWALIGEVARPADRPLLIRPAAGATVIWDGTDTINAPPFRIGWNGLLANVRFDPTGTGGSWTAQNYKIGKAGILMTKWVENFAFNGLRIRNCEGGYGDGVPGQPQHSHAYYLQSDGVHRSKNVQCNDWVVEGPASKMLNGLHFYISDGITGCDGIESLRWKVSSLNRAVFGWSPSTNVKIDGWQITNCSVTIDNYPNVAQGVVSNCKAINSGPITPGQGQWKVGPLTSGGGNTTS